MATRAKRLWKRPGRRKGKVAFKVVFGPGLKPIGVEDADGRMIERVPVARARPAVEKITVPLELLSGHRGAMRVCWVHMGCRVFAVPC